MGNIGERNTLICAIILKLERLKIFRWLRYVY